MSAVKRKRISYTAEFKLKVIEKAEELGNRKAGAEFQVNESNVRLWRLQKPDLMKTGNKRKRSNRHGLPTWPILEENLARWIIAQRETGASISTTKIRMKARLMALEMEIDNFKGGPGWCYRFMRRKNLRVRWRTTVGQQLPADWETKKESFLSFTKALITKEKYSPSQIINMDEVPLTFDCPANRTVEACGARTVSIATTGNEKTSFTVVLACAADGTKLSPMVIFKRKTMPKEDFPAGVVIRVNEKGWMNTEVMNHWLQEVWRKRAGAFFKPHGVLIMDSMRAHLEDSVKSASVSVSAKLSIIPGGLTKILQPLDITVNKSFKSKVRVCWENWMMDGLHTFTKTGRMRRATLAEVSSWVKTSWDAVPSSTIQKAFQKAGIVSTLSEDEDSADDNAEVAASTDLQEDFLNLFCSESDESEFEGF